MIKCNLTDDELRKWTAELLGINLKTDDFLGEFSFDEQVSMPVHNGKPLSPVETFTETKCWNPVMDRNQAAQVLDFIYKSSPSKRVTQRIIINLIVTDDIHQDYSRCGAGELWRLLAASPRELMETVWLSQQAEVQSLV